MLEYIDLDVRYSVTQEHPFAIPGGLIHTLNGDADSGLSCTMGEINTTPVKSLGLSHAQRIEMAPPCKRE